MPLPASDRNRSLTPVPCRVEVSMYAIGALYCHVVRVSGRERGRERGGRLGGGIGEAAVTLAFPKRERAASDGPSCKTLTLTSDACSSKKQ